jgi:hypothetical protein
MKGKKGKTARIAYIIRRNRRSMGLQRHLDFLGFLRAFEGSGLSLRNLLYRGPGSPRSNIWFDRLIGRHRRRWRNSCRTCWWFFIITA